VIERILPPLLVAVEERGDLAGELFASEQAALGRAVEARRREFTTGRLCARRAFARLGMPALALGALPDGAPAWPAGVVGSITHCAGYRACAVGRTAGVGAVGIDAEPAAPLPDGVLAAIALAGECRHVSQLQRTMPRVPWDRLLFSAKESVYKALYPLGWGRLQFEDARLTLQPASGTFHARVVRSRPGLRSRELGACSGRWLAHDGLVLTAVALA
jgi:4'-phosphopantetheinyl transferase EntD